MKPYNFNKSLNSKTGNNENPSKNEGKKQQHSRVRKAFSVLYCVILTIILLPISSFGQPNCLELNTPPGAICSSWIEYEKTIYLTSYGPQYGTCAITIGYSTRTCQVIAQQCTTTVVQFNWSWFGWDGSSAACANFTNYLFVDYPENTEIIPDNFGQYLGHLFEHLMDYHYAEYILGLTPAQRLQLKCSGSDPNCSMPPCSSYEASYIDASCKDMCVNFTNPMDIRVTSGICPAATQGCCVLSAKYCLCYDSMNQLYHVEANRTVTSYPGSCSGTGPLYGTCVYGPGNTVAYQPCNSICPIIDGQ